MSGGSPALRVAALLVAVVPLALLLLCGLMLFLASDPLGKAIIRGITGGLAVCALLTSLPAPILAGLTQQVGLALGLAVAFFPLAAIFWVMA